ncbi:uncharacterized protein CCOS01_17035 [Colletotrichum costaricense]|uniref:Uncharacterized protein n=3 Tax=Colletotrichum acutatum species complex TaxID=2707335 RepID=A0AAI9YED4_9PEZI|nr:uncharacterized protein CCOS01_17035 [Colletotrichum costaricense]XP_060382661.1 uncharacterized protein CTAM01_06790 [Colletotrichum tamarilloi]KAK1500191.1 hypothetical protein CTAM01_06790 [Colletotrichum tamarilloi]KAK1503177.1 hypothetical protein CCOS01_17035 [Colletotrichum costaricense]
MEAAREGKRQRVLCNVQEMPQEPVQGSLSSGTYKLVSGHDYVQTPHPPQPQRRALKPGRVEGQAMDRHVRYVVDGYRWTVDRNRITCSSP